MPKDVPHVGVLLVGPRTVAAADTTLLFSVYTAGVLVTTSQSAYAVPAGQVLRIMALQVLAQSSAIVEPFAFKVLVATAAGSLTITSTVGIALIAPGVAAAVASFGAAGPVDISAGTTIAIGLALAVPTSMTIAGVNVQGFLF